MIADQPYVKGTSSEHVAEGNSQRFEVVIFDKKIKFQCFANFARSHAYAALALVGTVDRFAITSKISSGRREMPDCLDESTLGVHVSRVKL